MQIASINVCLIPKGCIDFQQFTSFRTDAINCGKSATNMGSLQANHILPKMKIKYNCLAMETTLNFLPLALYSCSRLIFLSLRASPDACMKFYLSLFVLSLALYSCSILILCPIFLNPFRIIIISLLTL